nr:MAG TPA: hypothetical protein [Caudoviricetes sp.]DAK90243.1 MAG TPA: hypothetical protein [Caudoviricetes sp.]DAZ24359.1 MAG TPA: hypothetical protein [Caudoviricetes sp.]
MSFYRGKYGEKGASHYRRHHWRFDSVCVLGVLQGEILDGGEV